MSLELLVLSGPDKHFRFTLQPGPARVIGRGANADYHLSDPRVSRSHCQILLEGDQPVVICNGGSGGTFVNRAQVARQVLKPGDILTIGDTELCLQVGDAVVKDTPVQSPTPFPAGGEVPTAGKVDQLASLVGQTFSHFALRGVIGKGRASMVFDAVDTSNDRPVALKVLLPDFPQNESEKQRFIRGMKTALPLRHPNLVTVHAAGKTRQHCWVAMELVNGETMAQAIGRIGVAGMLDWRYGYKVAVHVTRALEYAHGQQIVHRNVTPTNILLDGESKTVKLGDLMFAKALEGTLANPITRPGELVGDVLYMSPERTRGVAEEIDIRSDLYGLGATVYALLTGRPPLDGATLVERITRIRDVTPERPTKYQMSIPAAFEGVVMKLLAKRPEQRYASAGDLLQEVERVGRFHGMSV